MACSFTPWSICGRRPDVLATDFWIEITVCRDRRTHFGALRLAFFVLDLGDDFDSLAQRASKGDSTRAREFVGRIASRSFNQKPSSGRKRSYTIKESAAELSLSIDGSTAYRSRTPAAKSLRPGRRSTLGCVSSLDRRGENETSARVGCIPLLKTNNHVILAF